MRPTNSSPEAELATRTAIGQRLAAGEDSLFGRLFELLAGGVAIRATNGELVYANRAALNQLGFDSLEALRARGTGEIMNDYIVQDEHGRPLKHDDVPSVRLLRGERVGPRLIRSVNRRTGDAGWTRLKTTPSHDDGELLGAMTVIEDVTAVKTAEIRMRVPADSGRRLASSLDYERTLRTVADLAAPSLADFCGVDLVDPRGSLASPRCTVR